MNRMMRKCMVMLLVVFPLFCFSFPQNAQALLITVDSLLNAVVNTSSLNYWEAGVPLDLDPGIYEIAPYSGAWTAWYVTDRDFAGYKWNVFIYQESTGQKYQLGDWTRNYPTPEAAFSAYMNQELLLTETQGGRLWFFIEDGYPSDNSGTVTASVNPVPEPSTMLLLGSGLAGLVAFRKRFKN